MEVTLALAILLGAGFVAAKLGQLIRLPSVTGYVCVGLILGPSGFDLITPELTGDKLDHFNQIALMLIAFGVGEHLELKRLRHTAKNVFWVSSFESFGAFLLVFLTIFITVILLALGSAEWTLFNYVALALLLGTVAMATAPASTMHVMREMKASGPWTTTLMQVVALDNGLAIMMFGIVASVCRHMGGDGSGSLLGGCVVSILEVVVSLTMGIITGLLIDFAGSKIKQRNEMLTAGLALLLLCGEGARYFDVSPLLAGMAAGFTIVNRDQRDVRFFRSLNAFETPIYVLFFTLAGTHLDITALKVAGVLGILYFFARGFGKVVGARFGAGLAKAELPIRFYLGQALVPQAGVAIGLIFLLQGDVELQIYTSIITPVVLAGVLLSEIVGPPLARDAVVKAGESILGEFDGQDVEGDVVDENGRKDVIRPDRVQLVPWSWEKLVPPVQRAGQVMFGASHVATVAGLARLATILAHYHHVRPCSVRVLPEEVGRYYKELSAESDLLFAVEKAEVKVMGYELDTAIEHNDSVAEGLLAHADSSETFGIILGHPIKGTAKEFQKVVEQVLGRAHCQVVIVRFSGVLHTERILVPISSSDELSVLEDTVCALSRIGRHRITLLRLLPPDERGTIIETCQQRLQKWSLDIGLDHCVNIKVLTTEARIEAIVGEAGEHDLLVMAASRSHGLEKLVFGSLAESVAQQCAKPMLIVYPPQSE
jgi:Kef-type K+ transport system membrane component KefB/nucleotide-binding universal stress UspA family protein